LEAVINLGLSLALIGPLGINGVLIGTCISYLYRTTDIILYTAKTFMPGTLKKTLGRLSRNLIVALGMVAVGLLVLPQQTDSWAMWVVSSILFAVVDGAVLLGVNVLFERDEFKSFLGRIKESFARRSAG